MDDREVWPSEDRGFARSLIRTRARVLLRAGNLPSSEQDELEQQLTVDLWHSSRSYDSTRGTWHGFATAAVAHAGTKILRNRFAQKRDARSTTSLGVTTVEASGEATELSQTVTERERGNHRGIVSLPAEVHTDLSIDLAQVTATLPADLQELLELSSTFTVPEIANQTGIKRSTLNDRLRKIRARLIETGIQNYF